MKIYKQHSLFLNRANRFNSNHFQGLMSYQIDNAINRATFFFMEKFAMVDKLPFESNQQRLDMLGNLVKNEDVSVIKVKDGYYELNLNKLNFSYAHAVSVNTDCVSFSFKRHDHLFKSLNNEFTKPNTSWGQGIAKIASSTDNNGLSVFLYSNTELSTVNFTYIKNPNPVFYGDYDSIEYLKCLELNNSNCNEYYNKSIGVQHSEINSRYGELIVDIAVYLTTNQTENLQLKQILQQDINLIT